MIRIENIPLALALALDAQRVFNRTMRTVELAARQSANPLAYEKVMEVMMDAAMTGNESDALSQIENKNERRSKTN